jgi:hypothetical protein
MSDLTGGIMALSVLLGLLATVNHPYQESASPAAGIWHLIPRDADEQNIPDHRMDLRLYPSPAPFRAAIVNRNTKEDIPYAVATFDGRTLRLQMRAGAGVTQAEMPWLQMTWYGTRFDGSYVDANGQPIAGLISFKLVRAKQ